MNTFTMRNNKDGSKSKINSLTMTQLRTELKRKKIKFPSWGKKRALVDLLVKACRSEEVENETLINLGARPSSRFHRSGRTQRQGHIAPTSPGFQHGDPELRDSQSDQSHTDNAHQQQHHQATELTGDQPPRYNSLYWH